MGQEVLNPVDVAGWQGNHDWISTGSLPMRWDFIDDILWKFWQKDKLQYQKFLKSIVGENETNPQTIVKKVIDFMFCDYDIKEEDLLDATEVFKSEDVGHTWTLKDTNWYVPEDMANASDGGCKLAVTPADPNRIYACLIGASKEGDSGWIRILEKEKVPLHFKSTMVAVLK